MSIQIDGQILGNLGQLFIHPGAWVGIAGCVLLIVLFMKVAQWGDRNREGTSSGSWVLFLVIVVIGLIAMGATAGSLQ